MAGKSHHLLPDFTPTISRATSFVRTPGESTPLLQEDSAERGAGPSTKAHGSNGANSPSTRSTEEPNTTWGWVKLRSRYYLPATVWVPNYSLSQLSGDFLSALTIASILIPQSMSYATSLAKLDAASGLFGAAIPGIVYALLGSCRTLNVGPEAALSLIVGQSVTAIVHDMEGLTHEQEMAIALALGTVITFQVGLISFVLGIVRLGFIDVVLSRALLRGFVTAVAVVIMVEQLIPMFGLTALAHTLNPTAGTIDKIVFLVENAWTHAKPLTSAVAFGALGTLVAMRFLKKLLQSYGWRWVIFVPEVFIVVVGATIMSDAFEWHRLDVDVLGSVAMSRGGGLFELPLGKHNARFFKSTSSTAILIAVAGFLDSIVAAKQSSARFGYTISPNRELVALGAGNLVNSFIPGSLPAYGAITRSKLNADTGARSQMSSLICSAFVLLAIFFLLPALVYLPKCVLAAVVLLVVWSLLTEVPEDVEFYWKMSAWIDFALMLLTFFATVIWNVEVGIGVSVAVSLLLVVRNSSKAHIKILGRLPGTEQWKPVDENPEAEEDVQGVLIIRIRQNLDFANTGYLRERLRRVELYGPSRAHPSEPPRRDEATALVFHMADVEEIDASAAQIFSEILTTYKSRGVLVHFAQTRTGVYKSFEKAGIVKSVGETNFHRDISSAIADIEQLQGGLMAR